MNDGPSVRRRPPAYHGLVLHPATRSTCSRSFSTYQLHLMGEDHEVDHVRRPRATTSRAFYRDNRPQPFRRPRASRRSTCPRRSWGRGCSAASSTSSEPVTSPSSLAWPRSAAAFLVASLAVSLGMYRAKCAFIYRALAQYKSLAFERLSEKGVRALPARTREATSRCSPTTWASIEEGYLKRGFLIVYHALCSRGRSR